MTFITFFFAASLAAHPVPDESILGALVDLYRSDADASMYLCGLNKCEAPMVAERTDVICEAASESLWVCFIEPKTKGKNFYTGVVARPSGAAPISQFVFFGAGIRVAKSAHNHVRDVVGREIGEGGLTVDYIYCWDGRHYIENCQRN